MGIIYRERAPVPDLHNYEPEYNEDGTEKHVVCDGARFHVLSWDTFGEQCSEKNCEINARRAERIERKRNLIDLSIVRG